MKTRTASLRRRLLATLAAAGIAAATVAATATPASAQIPHLTCLQNISMTFDPPITATTHDFRFNIESNLLLCQEAALAYAALDRAVYQHHKGEGTVVTCVGNVPIFSSRGEGNFEWENLAGRRTGDSYIEYYITTNPLDLPTQGQLLAAGTITKGTVLVGDHARAIGVPIPTGNCLTGVRSLELVLDVAQFNGP